MLKELFCRLIKTQDKVRIASAWKSMPIGKLYDYIHLDYKDKNLVLLIRINSQDTYAMPMLIECKPGTDYNIKDQSLEYVYLSSFDLNSKTSMQKIRAKSLIDARTYIVNNY